MEKDICIEKFAWESVLEIFAFKVDLFSIDEICIGFRIDDEGTYNEINEEMHGYNELLNFLTVQFYGIKENWFSEVAHPAFETNLTSLWGNKKIEEIWNNK